MAGTDRKKVKFELQFVEPFSTFHQGKPKPIPMVVQGLLPQGAFSVLGAAPKNSKSSLSRYLSVCITKGNDFLGRRTEQGDVVLASLEDPRQHTDNCLHVLGYDNTSENDGRIHILEKLPPAIEETVDLLGDALTRMPNVRILVIDTLAKALRVRDLNEYMTVLSAIEQLKDLSRRFDQLNVFTLAHCKKVRTDDPFEMLLGSTALRGEGDTNLVVFKEGNQRVIESEGRIIRNIPATILEATVVDCEGADVVKDFSLGVSLEQHHAEQSHKKASKFRVSIEDRIKQCLNRCPNLTASKAQVLKEVTGNNAEKIKAIDAMQQRGAVKVEGVAQSKTNPLTVTLTNSAAPLGQFMETFSVESSLV